MHNERFSQCHGRKVKGRRPKNGTSYKGHYKKKNIERVACTSCSFSELIQACSFLIIFYTAVGIRLMVILHKTLLGTDSKVMPRLLSQLVRSPFLGILTMIPLHQSLELLFSMNIFMNKVHGVL